MKKIGEGHKAKWELFGKDINEPAAEPYHNAFDRTRSDNIFPYYRLAGFRGVVPDQVLEDRNDPVMMSINAISDPILNYDLIQEHEITGIPIYIIYNYDKAKR